MIELNEGWVEHDGDNMEWARPAFDGVVEARDHTGALFGFDRTQSLSSRPAGEIALAAQQFGQEDDITVLTLTFASCHTIASNAA